MTRYLENAPACLVAHLEKNKHLVDLSESMQILERLLTFKDMERVWQAIDEATAPVDSIIMRCLADSEEIMKAAAQNESVAKPSEALSFMLWHLVSDAMHDAKTIDTAPAQTKNLIAKARGQVADLVKTLKSSEILRRASGGLTWEITQSWLKYPENISGWLYLQSLQARINQAFAQGDRPTDLLINSSFMTYELTEILEKFSEMLGQLADEEQQVKHRNNPRPVLIPILQDFFKNVLGRNSNELGAIVLSVVLNDPNKTYTGQDMRA